MSYMDYAQKQRTRNLVADALGDTPETAIPSHLLRRGLAEAFVAGTPSEFDAAIVQSHSLAEEPWCFGSDPFILLELLKQLDNWRHRRMSPNVPANIAGPLSSLVQQEKILRVQRYGDVYHTLIGRLNSFAVPEVRRLDLGDTDLIAAFEHDPNRLGFKTFDDLLRNGLAAGAVIDGKLVALAHTNAITARYGDIGVVTETAWRGHGFATAAASIVARRIKDLGRIPVWSAGEDNAASLRVAAKLGFVEVSRRVYLNTVPI